MLPLAGFNSFITKNRLFTPESRIIAAVSGGMDSVLMAQLLHAGGYQFAIAHCNFQLRGDESQRDEAFCHLLAQNLGVPFFATTFNTAAYAESNKVSVQMAARELRYRWFEQLRQQHHYDVVALAHHQNDTIETILLNLVRGTGIAGLHGIQPKSGNLVRPMLAFTRDGISRAVEDNNLKYVEDSSNASTKYARNKLRLEVVPRLKELNPNLENTFAAQLQYFNELESLLEQKVTEIGDRLFSYDKGDIHIPIAEIRKLAPMHLLLSGLLKPFGFNHTTVSDIIASLEKHPGRKFEAPGWLLVLDREKLIISAAANQGQGMILINEADVEAVFGDYVINISQADQQYMINHDLQVAAVDADKLVYPLCIRNWQQGDQFYPLGMQTRKKLSDFFTDQKVPLHQKTRVPILVNGNGDIIWVAGYRLDDRYKLTPQTKKISIFELSES